jgi:predicted Zn finger-like uncharacterized protein
MPVPIACTSCRARFNVNETTIGKRVKCPKCQTVFQAAPADGIAGGAPRPPAAAGYQQGAPPQPQAHGGGYGAPMQHGGYAPSPPMHHHGGGSWGTARTGLLLVLISLIGITAIVFIFGMYIVIAPSAGAFGRLQGGAETAGILFIFLGCTSIILGLLWFIGLCLCCTAPYGPAKSRAKVALFSIIGIVVLSLIGFVLSLVMAQSVANDFQDVVIQQQNFQQFNKGQPPPFPQMQAQRAANTGWGLLIMWIVLYGLMGILGLVGFIFWIMFFMAVADYFRSPALRTQAVLTIILLLLGPVVFYGVMFLMWRMNLGLVAARIFGILIIVIFGGVYTQYAFMVAKAMSVIKRGTGGA